MHSVLISAVELEKYVVELPFKCWYAAHMYLTILLNLNVQLVILSFSTNALV